MFPPDVGCRCRGRIATPRSRQAYDLAVTNGIKGSVFFIWQNNAKAAYPNVPGYIEF